MENIDIVINTIGASKMFNAHHTEIIEYEANKLLVESAKRHGVKKYIWMSG